MEFDDVYHRPFLLKLLGCSFDDSDDFVPGFIEMSFPNTYILQEFSNEYDNSRMNTIILD